jgi:hypothetical protein
MTEFIPAERATPIRQPSTANLMIDSLDRNNVNTTTAADFVINKSYSLMNGFFTRIAATEFVLEWNEPNLSANPYGNGNSNLGVQIIIISGGTPGTYNFNVPQGFYTVAQYIDTILTIINASSGTTGLTLTLTTSAGGWTYISGTAGISWSINPGVVIESFANPTPVVVPSGGKLYLNGIADMRLYRYIDVVSYQLTNNQSVKDATTGSAQREVLLRYYMDWDTPPLLDKYNYPIYMGYTAFQNRRVYNPPKQIRWQPNQPIGQVSFQLYPNSGGTSNVIYLGDTTGTNWRMTLQISEN